MDQAKGHGFIDSQRAGIEVFKHIPKDAPLIVVEAVWQYSHHVLAGLRHHQGPILVVANWSGERGGPGGPDLARPGRDDLPHRVRVADDFGLDAVGPSKYISADGKSMWLQSNVCPCGGGYPAGDFWAAARSTTTATRPRTRTTGTTNASRPAGGATPGHVRTASTRWPTPPLTTADTLTRRIHFGHGDAGSGRQIWFWRLLFELDSVLLGGSSHGRRGVACARKKSIC
ncbi:hypothetical protein [Streptomyces sp. DASNCL29]|uniref:hypothetical protein n=1 Tax=Streptomyces sp. DASNCL29 TaxID=2583819 RepID=UPI001F0F944E|nr:hypothetical protein [Streptomyces sp. DASNCL29]